LQLYDHDYLIFDANFYFDDMKTKYSRVIVLAVLLIVVIIAGIVIYLERNAGKLAGNYLQDRFAQTELSHVYEIEYKSLRVGLFSGKVNLKGLKMKPVSTFFTPNNPLRMKYPVVFEIEVNKLVISGVTGNLSLDLNEISLDGIEIFQPSVKMIEHLTEKEKQLAGSESASQKSDPIGKTESLPHTLLSLFSINDGRFEIFDKQLNRSVLTVERIIVSGHDLDLQTDDVDLANVVSSFDGLNVSLGDITYPTSDGFYMIKLAGLDLKTKVSEISASGFDLVPQYDKQEFGKKFGRQTDRFDLKIKNIGIEKIDFQKLLNDNQLWIEQIKIGDVHFDIYRDKNIARDLSVFPKLPHQVLAGLDMGVNVEKIMISSAHIIYQEVADGETEPGVVMISNGRAEVLNALNIASAQHVEKIMQWKINGDLYDQGTFDVAVGFSADHESGEFSFSGRVDEMDMDAFNQILVPNEYIRIDDGKIVSNQFQVDAGADYSTGTMNFQYEDLKVVFLKEKKNHEMKDRSFYSALANTGLRFLNLDQQETPADTAYIYFERDKNKSIFNYMVKSLLSGVKATVIPGQNLTPEKRLKKQEREERRQKRRQS
jgi:hypothetical protein